MFNTGMNQHFQNFLINELQLPYSFVYAGSRRVGISLQKPTFRNKIVTKQF